MRKNNEIDLRTLEERLVYGVAAIRKSFHHHPEQEDYVEDLIKRISAAYYRIKDEELREAV